MLKHTQNTQDHCRTLCLTCVVLHPCLFRRVRRARCCWQADRDSALLSATSYANEPRTSACISMNRPPQSQRSSPGSKGIARSVLPRARTTGSSRRPPSTRGAATSRRMQSGACSSKRLQTNGTYTPHRIPRRSSIRNFSTSPTAAASRYWSLVAISAVWFSATSRSLTIAPVHGGVLRGMSE